METNKEETKKKQFEKYQLSNQHIIELMERYIKLNNEHNQYIADHNHFSVDFLQHQEETLFYIHHQTQSLKSMVNKYKHNKYKYPIIKELLNG